MKKICIIDYQLGNLYSVKHACDHVGLNAIVSSDAAIIKECYGLILPGVGAFGKAMQHMEDLDLINPILSAVDQGIPLFGICLGLQLLFSESEEFGKTAGLDLIDGKVTRFPATNTEGRHIKVPQISWNTICKPVTDVWATSPLTGIEDNTYMYFVHSFFVRPDDEKQILSTTRYEDTTYCSAIQKDNIFAVQFHPEKSGRTGIQIYRNWGIIHQLI